MLVVLILIIATIICIGVYICLEYKAYMAEVKEILQDWKDDENHQYPYDQDKKGQ